MNANRIVHQEPQLTISVQDNNGNPIQANPAMIARLMQNPKTAANADVDNDFLTHARTLVGQNGFHHSKYALIGDLICFLEEINQTHCRACSALGHCYEVCPTYAKITQFAGTNPFYSALVKEYITGNPGGSSGVSGSRMGEPVQFNRTQIPKDGVQFKRARGHH